MPTVPQFLKASAGEPTFLQSAKAIFLSSCLNFLLLEIPASWVLHFAFPQYSLEVFICSFLAIVPLAHLLGFATEELSLRLGQTMAGLLNATLGNAVELIVAIIALRKCELAVVQSSLVGSILSNLLLVLGFCFIAGGTRFSEQAFSSDAAQICSSLLVISVIAVIIPSALFFSLKLATSESAQDQIPSTILKVSHGVAIILLVVYLLFLFFQLGSHKRMFADDSQGSISIPYTTAPTCESTDTEAQTSDEQHEKPKINLVAGILLIVLTTVLVAITSEALVSSIDGLTASGKITKEFIGLIILPIVSNAAEHYTAVTVSLKDKLNLSISIAVGSSIQIAVFVIPFIVTLGWTMGKPLPMVFDPFETSIMFLAVLTVNSTIGDGKSNYLEGTILLALFVIIAVAAFFYGGNDVTGLLTRC